jgi:hypothetical protein
MSVRISVARPLVKIFGPELGQERCLLIARWPLLGEFRARLDVAREAKSPQATINGSERFDAKWVEICSSLEGASSILNSLHDT